jgi:RNA polymerase sigma factor (sigma-70 family)
MDRALQLLREAALRTEGAGLTDGQLLECFVSRRETAALETLVRRHAPMVWGVCRRILCSHHDAEDAFQATFLVLVRKAASVVPPEMVANWLYGVARQTALKARAVAARRRGRQRQVTTMPESDVEQPQDPWPDVQTVLDEELSRLSEKYRVAIVLCDLEGKTRKEAARQLGCPEGTLAARLARGRALLARALAQRGVSVSGGALAAVLAQQVASAAAPAALVSATIRAVTTVAAGQAAAGLMSGTVAALTEGVIQAMFRNKLLSVTTVLFVLTMIGLGAGAYAYHGGKGRPGPAAQAPTSNWATEAAKAPQGGGNEPSDKARKKEAAKRKTDHERLQGAWEFVSVAQGNKVLKAEDLGKQDARWKTVTFTGDKVRFVNVNTGGKEVEFTGHFKLGSAQKPKEIDLVPEGAQAKDGPSLGLYELDGDVLRFCVWARPRPGRPASLDPKEGAYVLTFRRLVKE